jgi:hypothetical protein
VERRGRASGLRGADPHGTTFATPITLSLPFSGASEELVVLRLDDAEDGEREPFDGPITFEGGLAKVQIDHLSVYTLVALKEGGCPCFTGTHLTKFYQKGTTRPDLTMRGMGSLEWGTLRSYAAGDGNGAARPPRSPRSPRAGRSR